MRAEQRLGAREDRRFAAAAWPRGAALVLLCAGPAAAADGAASRMAGDVGGSLRGLFDCPLNWPGIAVAVVFGVALAFFGWAIYRFLAVAFGFFLGLFLGYLLAARLGFFPPEFFALGAAAALALVAVWFRRVIAFCGGGLAGLLIGAVAAEALLPGRPAAAAVCALAGFGLVGLAALFFTREAVILSSAALGAAAAVFAAWKTLERLESPLLRHRPDCALAAALVVGVLLAVGGVLCQRRGGEPA